MSVVKRATKKLHDAGFVDLQIKRGVFGYRVENRTYLRQAGHAVCDTADDAVNQVLKQGKIPVRLEPGESIDLCAD